MILTCFNPLHSFSLISLQTREQFVEDKVLYSSIYILCLPVCLFVCLYPINVKMAEPIGPTFFVAPRVTPGKVYGWSYFQKFASIKIRFFENFENPRNLFLKNREIFCFCYLLTRRTPVYFISNKIFYKWSKRWEKMGAKHPKILERRARSALNF